MDRDADMIPSSPTISSPSSSFSSDLDTESTGSFFPDRSTTLGSLMGVTFPHDVPTRTVRVSSRISERESNGGGGAVAGNPRRKQRDLGGAHRKGRSWWRLCRDEEGPTSLREFLKVERTTTASADVADGSFFFGGGGGGGEHVAIGGGPLFENGRVLPPPVAAERRRRERVPVLLAGICSGVNS